MISYKLAKKLKEARFPQFGDGFALILNKKLPESDQTMDRVSWRDFIHLNYKGEFVYEPTLSELIEACGDEFKSLEKGLDFWAAESLTGYREYSYNTPEEAVAKLYLKLNENNSNKQPQ